MTNAAAVQEVYEAISRMQEALGVPADRRAWRVDQEAADAPADARATDPRALNFAREVGTTARNACDPLGERDATGVMVLAFALEELCKRDGPARNPWSQWTLGALADLIGKSKGKERDDARQAIASYRAFLSGPTGSARSLAHRFG
jgi:hypothetical protein